jgi:hypothetical protein
MCLLYFLSFYIARLLQWGCNIVARAQNRLFFIGQEEGFQFYLNLIYVYSRTNIKYTIAIQLLYVFCLAKRWSCPVAWKLLKTTVIKQLNHRKFENIRGGQANFFYHCKPASVLGVPVRKSQIQKSNRKPTNSYKILHNSLSKQS